MKVGIPGLLAGVFAFVDLSGGFEFLPPPLVSGIVEMFLCILLMGELIIWGVVGH